MFGIVCSRPCGRTDVSALAVTDTGPRRADRAPTITSVRAAISW
jgi:hypothetical protein